MTLAKLVADALTDGVLDRIDDEATEAGNARTEGRAFDMDDYFQAWRTGILAALEAEQRKGGEDAPASLTPEPDEFVELVGMLSLATEQDNFHAAHALRLCWPRVQCEYELRLRTAEAGRIEEQQHAMTAEAARDGLRGLLALAEQSRDNAYAHQKAAEAELAASRAEMKWSAKQLAYYLEQLFALRDDQTPENAAKTTQQIISILLGNWEHTVLPALNVAAMQSDKP